MSGLQIMVTAAGRQEIINAENTGTDPVLISEIGLGTGKYEPSESQTALQAEFKRLTTVAGQLISDDTIHVSAVDDSSDEYSYSEFGLYTDSGTLFAVYSQQTDISSKSAQGNMLLSADVVLTRVNATSLTFGDASFTNPPASETVKGVLELANSPEGLGAEDHERAMTSLRTHEAIRKYGLGTSGENGQTLVSPDFNEIQTTGFYYVSGTPSNGPAAVAGQGHLVVSRNFTGASNHIHQEFLQYNGDRKFFRRMTGGSWKPWQEIAHDGNMENQLAVNGYQKLSTGLIIQWGVRDTGISASGTITLPITFPNATLHVGILDYSNDSNSTTAYGVNNSTITTSSFDWIGKVGSVSGNFNWFAIGY